MVSASQARVRRSAVWSLAGNACVPLAGFLSAPVLAQGLGTVGRGEVAACIGVLLLVTTVSSLGMPEAVTYFTARNSVDGWRALKLGMVLAGCASMAGALLILINR